MLALLERQCLDRIEGYAGDCTALAVLRSEGGIAIAPKVSGGFDMALSISGGAYTLCFDRWEETFDDPDYVCGLIEDALTGEARLRVDTLAKQRWRWTLERRDASGRWVAESTIGYPTWRFWGKAGVEYLRNAVVLREADTLRLATS